MFANLGLPGLAGFVGEFYIMRAVWANAPLLALGATIGLVITGLALLRWYGQVFHGTPRGPHHAGPELVEVLALAPVLAGLVAFGLYPAPILDLINRTALSLAAALAGGPPS
jgi:NADH-quinone oxidoreductase subunit M